MFQYEIKHLLILLLALSNSSINKFSNFPGILSILKEGSDFLKDLNLWLL